MPRFSIKAPGILLRSSIDAARWLAYSMKEGKGRLRADTMLSRIKREAEVKVRQMVERQ